MLSMYFFVWALVGAAVFGGTAVLAAGRFTGLSIILSILGFALGWLFSLWARPAIDPFLSDSVLLFLVLYGIAAALSMHLENRPLPTPIILGVVLVVGAFVASFATTFSGFHAARYAELVSPVQATRDTSIPLIDQTQARLVTDELARKRAAELISGSDEQGIGSRVTIGEMWGNEIGGTMYWIAPLEHSGFFRWLNFGTTPGYIMVSQFNEVNARFVQDKPIKIGVDSFMSDNVYRRLYMNGYINYDYADAMFQVDDEGNPYWVVPMLYPQVGFGGYMPVKWALVNAGNGDIEVFDDPKKLPEWIDRVYPSDVISARFDDWGCLGQGWVACMFTGQNVIQSTPGINVTINPKGDIVYYSGTQFSNARSEGASSGLFLADARTGEITFYPRAGITEEAAKQVLTQAYANYDGYSAAEPVLLSVNGIEAYFSIVLDRSGVRKGFGMVAQDNRNIIGIGNSVQAAVTEFNRSLQRSSRDSAFESGSRAVEETVKGVIATYTPYVQNGKTVFYISIDALPHKIFEVSEEKIGEIVATKVGDPVQIGSDNFLPGIVFVTSFDNLRLELKEEGLQPVVDKSMQEAAERYAEEKQRVEDEKFLDTKKLEPEDIERLKRMFKDTGQD